MISVEEARATILAAVSQMPVVEVPLLEARGRVLAKDVVSSIDINPFNNSSMDGFALRHEDVAAASEDAPVSLKIVAHIGAGYHYDKTLEPGQAVRIMTGAPVPAGCDCVEKIENVQVTGEGTVDDTVIISQPVREDRNIRHAGEEVKAGGTLVSTSVVIKPATIGLFASAGMTAVPVYARPKVGVFSLGSELTVQGNPLEIGHLYDSNSFELAAQAADAGCDVVRYGTVPDDEQAIETLLSRAIDECDFVVTSGGASAGDYDYITQIADKLGSVSFKYVNMRPGKSQTFAVIRNTPFMGLAGNPAAAAVGFEMLVRPALRKMQGFAESTRVIQKAALVGDCTKRDPRRNYMRGTIAPDGKGGFTATPAKKQSSALYGALSNGNCLITIPEGVEFVADGSLVDCVRIDIPEGTAL